MGLANAAYAPVYLSKYEKKKFDFIFDYNDIGFSFKLEKNWLFIWKKLAFWIS